jgi:methionyl-tRNA formyltransferase
MKIIFAGTPDFAVAPFDALVKEHEVVAAFTQPDRKAGRGKKLTSPPVKAYALKIGVPVFQPTSLRDQAELIRSLNADLIVVVAYGMLLPQEILDIPPLGCLNIHASVLPRWRGAAPIQRAIEAGDKQTGVSIMRMELGLDTGPVFKTLLLDIQGDDTSETMHDKLAKLGAKGICDVVKTLQKNPMLAPTPQDHATSNYARKITKTEAEINWHRSAKELHQQLRAFIPWPISQTTHNGTRLRLWQASPLAGTPPETPGTIIAADESGFDVACADGVLHIEKLQRDGSKPMIYSEFRNGYTLSIGDRLGAIRTKAASNALQRDN